jgi:ketosteroid isomerase-like protein
LARATRDPADLDALREFLAEDVVIRMASPWTDSPWRVVISSADELLARLNAPINQATSLTTKTVNPVQAGSDVLVEQVSTVTRDGRDHVSIVCHIFTINDGRITGIRTYRNDAGIPPG